jgi:hypothetical protein
LFAQVVTSTCKTLDEREILRNAYELLSAFDELVTLGYRENLTISQIKTFLEMESHEERIQEIISRVGRIRSYCIKYLIIYRTRSWRPPRNGNARRSSWRCSARRSQEVAETTSQEHQYTLHIPHQHEILSQRHTIHMRQKRTNLTSKSIGPFTSLFANT